MDETKNKNNNMAIYKILFFFFFFLVYDHGDHTAKQISLHLSLFSAATLHGISGSMLSASLLTQSSQRKRGLPKGLLPTGFSSIVVLTMDPTLRHACPVQVNLFFLISFAIFGLSEPNLTCVCVEARAVDLP